MRSAGVLFTSAEFVSEEDARSLVLDPFADDHLAADIHKVKNAVDRVTGSSAASSRIQGGILGRANELEFHAPLDILRPAHH